MSEANTESTNKFKPKVRYVFKHTVTGEIQYRHATLEEIEQGALKGFQLGLVDFDLVSRDRYIGMKDANNREIYENDVDSLGWVVSGIEGNNASCGSELGWYTQRDDFESFALIEYQCGTCGNDINISILGTIHEGLGRVRHND